MAYYKPYTSLPEHWRAVGNRWVAYEAADTLADFRAAWKRTRVWKCGLVHPDAFTIEPRDCYICGTAIVASDRENRPYVEWKRGWSDLRVKHYRCAWGETMEGVARLGRALA